jgi:predicted GIY-YIG superfamily endonuclease
MKSGIYKITNVNNGKAYIGRALNIEKRWQEHKEALAAGTHHSYKLQECYNSLENKDDLKYEIIEEVAYENERVVKEQYYMDKYDAYHNGYNCCEFADNPKYIQPKKEDIHNFVFLASWYEIIEAYEKMGQSEMASEISKAIITYGVTGEILSDNPLVIGVVRGMCTALIDKSKARYAHSIENGKKGGRPKKFNAEDMIALRNQGLTDQDIADNLGCSVKTVQRALATADADDEI